MSYIYKVFEHLKQLWMGICLWSQNDVKKSWSGVFAPPANALGLSVEEKDLLFCTGIGRWPLLCLPTCRSPDSWIWTDHSQISLLHSPIPPKCSTRAIVALINNLGIVYHQYCSSSYLDYSADHGPAYHSRQWKSSSNLIPQGRQSYSRNRGFLRTRTSLRRHRVPSTRLRQRYCFDRHHRDPLQHLPCCQEDYSFINSSSSNHDA
jgi:hypothetical protein